MQSLNPNDDGELGTPDDDLGGDGDDLEKMQRDGLDNSHVFGYAVGHVCNDLCAAMWFFYLAWYLNIVVGLSKRVTALCGLSGQIADGIATPIVGILSDKYETKVGKRMPYYYFGALLVIPTALGIWSYPEFINDHDPNIPYDD